MRGHSAVPRGGPYQEADPVLGQREQRKEQWGRDLWLTVQSVHGGIGHEPVGNAHTHFFFPARVSHGLPSTGNGRARGLVALPHLGPTSGLQNWMGGGWRVDLKG